MYNYPTGQYGAPPGYTPNAPGNPTMAAPGTAPAPGLSGPPGIQSLQNPLPARPGAMGNAPLIPNINMHAPVIHLGTSRTPAADPAGGRRESGTDSGARRGLGMSDGRSDLRHNEESQQALRPFTKEEIARTIYVGNITKGCQSDAAIERLLSCAGYLRRWRRCMDAENKPCTFGLAEYADAESLETAAELLKDIKVPVDKQEPGQSKKMEEIDSTALLVTVDEASLRYAEEWKARRGEDESASEARIKKAREALELALNDLFNPPEMTDADHEDTMMRDAQPDGIASEFVPINLSTEDELADIPADKREMVAAEIAAFRDRSNRRDLERLRREEEAENRVKKERERLTGVSSPRTAPSGPAGGANGIPLGPRDRGVQGAPSGPKGYQPLQSGVSFVNGKPLAKDPFWPDPDSDDPASDEEIERRRQAMVKEALDKEYREKLKASEAREKNRAKAAKRAADRDKHEKAEREQRKQFQLRRLQNWKQDAEERKKEPKYQDPSAWARSRAIARAKEEAEDNADREAERRELARESQGRAGVSGSDSVTIKAEGREAEDHVDQMPAPIQRFKMSLGAAAQKAQQASAPRHTAAEVEWLLDEEEEDVEAPKRTLVPIKYDPTVDKMADLTEEERAAAQKQLASEIPADATSLFAWDVSWNYVDNKLVNGNLKSFVKTKIHDLLGMDDEDVVDAILNHLLAKGTAHSLIEELDSFIDVEAEPFVKKLWRMLIFYSESAKRGIADS